MSKPPKTLANGRVILFRREHFLQWCAWREWLATEVGREFWPEKICVWSEWPPESAHMAQSIVDAIAATRPTKDGRSGEPISDKPVCGVAHPWARWSAKLRQWEEKHADDEGWNPPLPRWRGNPERLAAE